MTLILNTPSETRRLAVYELVYSWTNARDSILNTKFKKNMKGFPLQAFLSLNSLPQLLQCLRSDCRHFWTLNSFFLVTYLLTSSSVMQRQLESTYAGTQVRLGQSLVSKVGHCRTADIAHSRRRSSDARTGRRDVVSGDRWSSRRCRVPHLARTRSRARCIYTYSIQYNHQQPCYFMCHFKPFHDDQHAIAWYCCRPSWDIPHPFGSLWLMTVNRSMLCPVSCQLQWLMAGF